MNQSLYQYLKHLKSVLLSLPATGETGFEGLIGAALREISGVPFRLAGSGSQFGVDGKSVYDTDAICFEGKRYKGKIPKNEVISKIAELSITDTGTDVWVLGATSQIKSQLADSLRKLGAKDGIVVLILDWSETDLPPFAIALAMGASRVKRFLKNNIKEKTVFQKTVAALEAVKKSPDFGPQADKIRVKCNESAMGSALARRANTDWLSDGFCNRKRARIKFGQPLSPGDNETGRIRKRKKLIDKLYPYLAATPDETVVFILGGEGYGKSWIVAQSWLSLENKPLMVFMGPDDFSEKFGQIDVIDFLIAKLIKQTGSVATETTRERWRRWIERWRSRLKIDIPRLIVVIDGINQRPKFDWARIIEGFGDKLYQLGGRLIVTVRTPYFRQLVQNRLSVPFIEINISEWTETERNNILNEFGIKASELNHSVATSLLNPRLLGIALELLDRADVTNLEELSVSRLLFEHIRVSERDSPMAQPANEFMRQLQKHAQEIISRVKKKQLDDLKIFENDIAAVADGRFYQELNGDPTRYSLKDEGLTLALALSLIDRLRIAKRNARSLDAELDEIIEPVAALDDTADVILSALTVAIVDDSYDQDIVATLVKGFAVLQNPDQNKFISFAGLTKRRPQGFMDAAKVICLREGFVNNYDWIKSALIKAGRSSDAWQKMVKKVNFWLSVYSLSPELGTFQNSIHESQNKIKETLEKNRVKIKEKLQTLSVNESAILNNLFQEEGDLSKLSRLAFELLAGKSLGPFARSLLNWSFSNSLNSDPTAPYEEFRHLVSLNTIDWSKTRAALLEECSFLREENVSKTGKWALVNILRATGHSDDGKEAQSLVEDLTKDWPSFKGWRLVEDYCRTDPCDPVSKKPKNIIQTAEKYSEIDVNKLRQGRWQNSEDHFFIMARTGVARFEPAVVIKKHKEFALNVLTRTGLPFSQGLSELLQHKALLANTEVRKLIKIKDEAKIQANTDKLPEKNKWIFSLKVILLFFPFLNAQEQAKILLSKENDNGNQHELLKLAKPISKEDFEAKLRTACDEDNEFKQYLLLEYAKYTSVPLSKDARSKIAMLFRSDSDRVRTEALGFVAQSGDEELLYLVATSDWKTMDKGENTAAEDFYGSVALLKAAERGLISHRDVPDRISTHLYGWAAEVLDVAVIRNITKRIGLSIKQLLHLDDDLVVPDIELQVHRSSPYKPGRFQVGRRELETNDIRKVMEILSESDEAFEKRQKRNYEAFVKFKTDLTRAKAQIVLDNLSLKGFEKIIEADENLANQWYDLFMNIAEAKLPIVHNLILLLAYAFGEKAPYKAKKLFLRVKDSEPLVRITFNRAGLQLDLMASWAGLRNPVLDKLRFERLDQAATDHHISIEVLAALINGQQELLTEYIDNKLRKKEPSEVARGIMVAGFSDQSDFNDEILKRHESCAGLIGNAQKAAKYAFERNVWARHWFEKMCMAKKNSDFWCYAILFLKIVDGRFFVWRLNYTQQGSPFQLFEHTVDRKVQNRFERWKNHRSKKLFGLDAPKSIFLEGQKARE